MQEVFDQIYRSVLDYAPTAAWAAAILVGGWLAAVIIREIIHWGLRKTTLDNRLAALVAGDKSGMELPVERWISRAVYYVLMLFVLMAFFERLNLTVITEPINELLKKIFEFVPQLFGAVLLIMIAWGVAEGLRFLIARALSASKLDQKLGEQAACYPVIDQMRER